MTTDNLNPADRLYEAAKELLKEVEVLVYVKQSASKIMKMRETLTAYEKSKEEQQSEKVPIHKCEYCGAMTEQPDEVCWNNPDRQPTQEPESKDGEMDFDLEIEGTAEILMGSDSLPANVIILSGLINRATKDLTDEVERLKSVITVKNETIDELIDALKELCELKHYKDNVGRDSIYRKRQPEAWKQANALLNNLIGYGEKANDEDWSGGFADNH